jgi:hypothetical protein
LTIEYFPSGQLFQRWMKHSLDTSKLECEIGG